MKAESPIRTGNPSMCPPIAVERIHGVDFSGAAKAGNKIWVASGTIRGDSIHIDFCQRARALANSGADRDRCLLALRDSILSEPKSLVGIDFPFGLPQGLIGENSWERFVASFADRYPEPELFREDCLRRAHGRELRRVTDCASQGPFSPYNLRIYRQTYFGIRDLLGPVVRNHLACVLPMQQPVQGQPWIVEICPASTLKRYGLYVPYKGRFSEHRQNRKRILEEVEKAGSISIESPALRQGILDDHHGDALDSVVAVFAVSRAANDVSRSKDEEYPIRRLEGHIFV